MKARTQDEVQDGKKGRNLLSNLLVVVGIALLAAAGYAYWQSRSAYQQIDETNARMAEYVRLSDDSDVPPEVDWDALKAMNPDVVGWLQVPGTIVNYPVFQTTDNDFYLHHAPDRSESIGGSVFMDCENTAPGMIDSQTIVYGHHMRNGSQFKQIADMDDQTLFDGVRRVWYVTEENAYRMSPLFLYYTSEDDWDVRYFTFASDAEWRSYLRSYLGQAVTKRADADAAVNAVSRVLTLSTCNYYDGYGRTLLVCALADELGE